jgi:hypothetical protein
VQPHERLEKIQVGEFGRGRRLLAHDERLRKRGAHGRFVLRRDPFQHGCHLALGKGGAGILDDGTVQRIAMRRRPGRRE